MQMTLPHIIVGIHFWRLNRQPLIAFAAMILKQIPINVITFNVKSLNVKNLTIEGSSVLAKNFSEQLLTVILHLKNVVMNYVKKEIKNYMHLLDLLNT